MTPFAAIQSARLAGDYPEAQRLIFAEVEKREGNISSGLADQLALLQMQVGAYREARDILLMLVAKFPDSAGTWRAIGECSERLGEYAEARDAFQSAIESHNARPQPDAAKAYFGYGSQLFRLGNPDTAEQWWRDGLSQPCDTPGAKMQRGHVALTFGDASGWADTEERVHTEGHASNVRGHGLDPDRLPPAWDGKADGRVMVYGDQGAGDAIFFARYLPQITYLRGNDYAVKVGGVLRSLLDGWDTPPRCEWSCGLSSLPFLLDLPEPVEPSLPLPPWTKPRNAKPRVGVCWYGAKAYENDLDRSCPFDPRPLLTSPEWDLHSLQQGIDFESPDYRWNAGYLRHFDAVLTVDSSTVHLAGSMGVPTILMAQSKPFWLWGTRSAATPHYPSVHIVRRKTVFEWEDAWARAKAILEEML